MPQTLIDNLHSHTAEVKTRRHTVNRAMFTPPIILIVDSIVRPDSRLVLMMELNKKKTGFRWGHTLGFMWLNGKLLMFISIIVLFPLTAAHRFKTEVQLV